MCTLRLAALSPLFLLLVAACGREAPPAASGPHREVIAPEKLERAATVDLEKRDRPLAEGEQAPPGLDLPPGPAIVVFFRGHW